MLTPERATAQPGNPTLNALNKLQQEVEAQRPRKFCLTPTTHDGLQAPAACAQGYHMASLWEIFDTTGLRYERTLGLANHDSGFGPPADLSGWIRTGANSQAGGGAGDSNCNAYTSNLNSDRGTAIELSEEWDTPGDEISPWDHFEFVCNIPLNVWCVQD